MKHSPRRRRLDYDDRPSSGGGMPIFPLAILIILLGFLLGGGLHYFLGRGGAVVVPTPFPRVTPLAQTPPPPTPVPTAATIATSTPKRSPKPSPKPSASVAPSASPVIIITPAPSPSASLQPTSTPSPLHTPAHKLRRATVQPLAAPAVAPPTVAPQAASTVAPTPTASTSGASGAKAVVRAYLAALARGDASTATSYLAKGLPSETFMNASAHINSLQATQNSDGSYAVTADITTSSGEYFSTFTVEHGPFGMQITDHYSIKPG